MDPAAPTPQALYKRLRELYPDLSEEKLARELELGTVKTLSELNKGVGPRWETAIRLLQIAGWLSVEDADGRAATARGEQLLRRAERALDAIRRP